MKTPTLFNLPKMGPTKREKIEQFKKQHGIWTHKSGVPRKNDPWCALLSPKTIEVLFRYGDVTKDTHPVEIIAGYCRLLDESGLLVCGMTEVEAIRTLCTINKIDCPI